MTVLKTIYENTEFSKLTLEATESCRLDLPITLNFHWSFQQEQLKLLNFVGQCLTSIRLLYKNL